MGSTCLLVGGALAFSVVVASQGWMDCGRPGDSALWAFAVGPALLVLCGILFVMALRWQLGPAIWGWVLVAAIFGPMVVLAVLGGTAELCSS